MNLETILLISIICFPLSLTCCYLIVKRGLYWINGQAIIPAPNQTINIISMNEITDSMTGIVGRYTKVLSFFGSLRIDPNFNLSGFLIAELGTLIQSKYIQKRFTLDLVDLRYMNSTATNEIIKFLLNVDAGNICEVKIVFPLNHFQVEFLNLSKLFENNKNITLERASHGQ